ncbi:MAG TPA: septum formation initiator family protein [Desulfomonilaceae bacterium]|nr:septum formation initiator family protein [Desulfomonilaceae bacterium]
MKHILGRVVKYLEFALLFIAVSAVGILMGEQTLIQKQKLEEKKYLLEAENKNLVGAIKGLERKVTLMRSDQKTIEKVAKRKLGMAKPDETVYMFEPGSSSASRALNPEYGLGKNDNLP